MGLKKLYRTVIEIEVLSEEPIYRYSSLESIARECNIGKYSGATDWKTINEVIEGNDAVLATIAHATSCNFFSMDDEGNEI